MIELFVTFYFVFKRPLHRILTRKEITTNRKRLVPKIDTINRVAKDLCYSLHCFVNTCKEM